MIDLADTCWRVPSPRACSLHDSRDIDCIVIHLLCMEMLGDWGRHRAASNVVDAAFSFVQKWIIPYSWWDGTGERTVVPPSGHVYGVSCRLLIFCQLSICCRFAVSHFYWELSAIAKAWCIGGYLAMGQGRARIIVFVHI